MCTDSEITKEKLNSIVQLIIDNEELFDFYFKYRSCVDAVVEERKNLLK